MSRLHLTMLRRARIACAMRGSMAIPYVRRCAAILDRLDAIENGLRTRAVLDRVAALPDLLTNFVNRNLAFGAAK